MRTVDHIAGHTWHGRKGAVENAFRYGIDYVLLDAEAAVEAPWIFGRNRMGLASVRDRDHGGPPGQGRGAAWVREVLAANALPAPARIELLAQPRMLGHVFNPVAFWICRDDGGEVRVIIAEVSNTYGERHSYLCHRDDLAPITAEDRIRATKIFYVSPFQRIEGGYEFRFDLRPDRIGIWIDFTGGNGGVIATLVGTRRPLRTGGLIAAMLRRPLGSRRVLALIHWQALKLWWKGAQFRSPPAPPAEEVSR
ncbi:hypothetical protein SAMN05443999_102263 [Roseovarius azorensis]|uniref:Cyclopropane-fatty-acyl-phospholipid synthase n=1 Tax=Roseovarius azorensis TaxID=1287727 RepID=A0A1H7JYT1_9RHOB|nr:DUF1365 domain-containing protein [Roseovarius azorensis]SEK78775.1 hypothetical protein SAMN05443999_102263 [Roseovarius azorensis]